MLMKLVLAYVILFYSSAIASGQDDYYVVPDYKGTAESFFSLGDSLIRSEAGSFSFAGSILGLNRLNELQQLEIVSLTDHTIALELDDIKVSIARSRFFPSSHDIEYWGHMRHVLRIDGRYFWGFDGRMPKQRIVYIEVLWGDERIRLPASAFRDIFEPNFCSRPSLFGRRVCHTRVFISDDGERLYIYMRNSEMPSLYEVTWILINGRYIGRIVDYAY